MDNLIRSFGLYKFEIKRQSHNNPAPFPILIRKPTNCTIPVTIYFIDKLLLVCEKIASFQSFQLIFYLKLKGDTE